MEKSSKLAKAIARTVLDHPFFASLLLGMRLREDSGTRTACTNGKEIRYNPDFIDSLQVDQVVFVLAHLVMHVAHHPSVAAQQPRISADSTKPAITP